MFIAHPQSAAFEADHIVNFRESWAPPAPVTGFPEPGHAPSRYGSSGRSRFAIPLIVLAHFAGIVALVKLDVVHVARKSADPVLIELKPLAEAPPAKPQPKQEQAPKVATPIVSPPPIVATLAPPPQVATVPVAPAVVTTQPAAPALSAPVIAAPIVPPDGSAANLGNPAPRYPVESRRAHEEGAVRLKVLISPQGEVEEISVARSSGYDRLDRAALETVRRWRFRSGTQAGKPVEAVGYLSIPFVLAR